MEHLITLARGLKCGYVSCNFRDLATDKFVFPSYNIIEYSNTKVAFVGVCTPATMASSNPSFFTDGNGKLIYDFDGNRLEESIQEAADNAKKDSADFVILIGHLGESGVLEKLTAQ